MKKRERDIEKLFQMAKMRKVAEKVKNENIVKLARYGVARF